MNRALWLSSWMILLAAGCGREEGVGPAEKDASVADAGEAKDVSGGEADGMDAHDAADAGAYCVGTLCDGLKVKIPVGSVVGNGAGCPLCCTLTNQGYIAGICDPHPCEGRCTLVDAPYDAGCPPATVECNGSCCSGICSHWIDGAVVCH